MSKFAFTRDTIMTIPETAIDFKNVSDKVITYLRSVDIDKELETLNKATEQFDALYLQKYTVTDREQERIWTEMMQTLETYYRQHYFSADIRFMRPWGGRSATFTNAHTFISADKKWAVRTWNNGLYHVFPIRSVTTSMLTIISDDSKEYYDAGYVTDNVSGTHVVAITAIMEYFIALAVAFQKKYGEMRPKCEEKDCEYCFGGRCIYAQVRVKKPELRLCDDVEKEDK